MKKIRRRKFLKDSPDVFVVEKASAISDFALLSSLDHQIMSHGTFGAWIALLSKAETVAYPAPYYKKRHYMHRALDALNLPNFVRIKFTPSN